jgi:hypothetical protein
VTLLWGNLKVQMRKTGGEFKNQTPSRYYSVLVYLQAGRTANLKPERKAILVFIFIFIIISRLILVVYY